LGRQIFTSSCENETQKRYVDRFLKNFLSVVFGLFWMVLGSSSNIFRSIWGPWVLAWAFGASDLHIQLWKQDPGRYVDRFLENFLSVVFGLFWMVLGSSSNIFRSIWGPWVLAWAFGASDLHIQLWKQDPGRYVDRFLENFLSVVFGLFWMVLGSSSNIFCSIWGPWVLAWAFRASDLHIQLWKQDPGRYVDRFLENFLSVVFGLFWMVLGSSSNIFCSIWGPWVLAWAFGASDLHIQLWKRDPGGYVDRFLENFLSVVFGLFWMVLGSSSNIFVPFGGRGF